jgi:hypothetical protein
VGEKRIIRVVEEYEPLTEEEKFSEEEQIEECCEEVSVDECADVGKKVSVYTSYDTEELDIDVEALTAEMEEQYGERSLGVKLIAVGPTGNCGEKIETWEGRNDCCDEVAELVYDTDNSVSVLAPGTRGIVEFTGGKLPVLVKIRGNGFSLDGYNTRDAWAYSRRFYVYSHEFACGAGPITLDDGCTTATGAVRATVGRWNLESYWASVPFYYNNHPEIYDCVTNFYLYTLGDRPNFPWFSGEYMLSGTISSRNPDEDIPWRAGAGRNCSRSGDLIGTEFSDPYKGIFTWVGVVNQHHIVGPPEYYRLFVAGSSDGPYMAIWRWLC